jgi:hypothetical protein
MIRAITDKDPQAFYRDVLECEAEEAPENDAQTSLMSLAGRKGIFYQAQLYDDPDVWTLPLPLTRERAEMLLEDDSVSQIKLIIESKL